MMTSMDSIHDFAPGDYLIFQLEAGYGLLRILDLDETCGDFIWHIAAYRDLFLDPETADAALDRPQSLTVEIPHAALTNRAFESTQVAKMRNVPITDEDLTSLRAWKLSSDRQVYDRSVRLLLGLR
jgi:hypothetical protein